jgi:hypothetical protein
MSLELIVSTWKNLNVYDFFALPEFVMIILSLMIILSFVFLFFFKRLLRNGYRESGVSGEKFSI